MLIYRALAFAVLCASVQTVAAANAPKRPLNGWYPCSEFTFSNATGERLDTEDAECAVYSAPLCHPGVCVAPATVDPTVDIFVKRVLATDGNVATASNAWFFSGGPGLSSVDMEKRMREVHERLKGMVNVYTLDHRGTGRSTFFDCVASQTTTSGSPMGSVLDYSEIPYCAKDLHTKYGDLASFSTTSAASDIAAFISEYSNGASTFVYGESYGTALIERLMHLNPVTVKGYIIDGAATTSGASPGKFEYFSMWDADLGDVGEYFMGLCTLDSACKAHFPSGDLSMAVRDLLSKLDNDANSTCSTLISVGEASTVPSDTLKPILAMLLREAGTWTLIPPLVYRLNRCNANDVNVLNQFFSFYSSYTAYPSTEGMPFASLINSLIMYSEMWETPTPSDDEFASRFKNSTIASGGMNDQAAMYCAFSKEKSAVCDEINLGNYSGDGIIYKRDRYWNKAAVLPSGVSVLLMNGKLDQQTSYKYAQYLLEALGTSKKELITFDYAIHDIVRTTQLGDPSDPNLTCGMKLLVSFISNNGDLRRLDRSCVSKMPAFNLTVPPAYLYNFFKTNDAYDGIYQVTN